MFYNILLIVQIIVSAGIIVLVLMQHGKGADAGAAFGSGASGSVFGSQGSANFLSRATAILATVFFLNSMGLAWMVSNRTTDFQSVMDAVTAEPVAEEVAAPANDSDVPAIPGQEASSAEQNSEVPAAPAASEESSEVPAAPAASEAEGSEVPATDSATQQKSE